MNPTHRGPLAATILALCLASPAWAASDLAISQVYGGGGNSGAPFTHDFVELFNRGQAPVSLGGKSIQYASATGSFSNVFALPAATVQPGQYYLVQLAGGGQADRLDLVLDGRGVHIARLAFRDHVAAPALRAGALPLPRRAKRDTSPCEWGGGFRRPSGPRRLTASPSSSRRCRGARLRAVYRHRTSGGSSRSPRFAREPGGRGPAGDGAVDRRSLGLWPRAADMDANRRRSGRA